MKKFLRILALTAVLAVLGGSLCVAAARPKTFDKDGRLPLITEPDESAQDLIFCRGDDDLTMDKINWVAGQQGKAVRFNGVDEYFRIGYNSLQLADFTLSMWVKWEGASTAAGGSTAENQRIFSVLGEYRNRTAKYITLSPLEKTADGADVLRMVMKYQNSTWELAHPQSRALPQDAWHHLAIVSTEETLALYLDGTLLAEEMTMMGLANMRPQQLYLGKGVVAGGDGYFNGLMDDVYLYKKALTAAELGALITQQKPTTTATTVATTTAPTPEDIPDVSLQPDYSLPAIPPVVWIVAGSVAGLVVLLTVIVNIRHAAKRRK